MTAAPHAHILIVDDDVGILKAYTRLLQKHGYEVSNARSAEEAFRFVQRQPNLDLLLSDIGLPANDGLAVLRHMREIMPDLPIVLMTGGPTIESAIKAVEYGAFRYLLKPVEETALLEVVDQAVRLRRLAELQRQAAQLRTQQHTPDEATRHIFDEAIAGMWMAYQPIVSYGEQRIVAYEALLRSHSPEVRGPGDIFDAAEKLDGLHQLGRKVRHHVAGEIGALDPTTLVFVNLHPTDLLDEDLFARTSPLSVHAKRVVLEVTEREPLAHIDDLKGRLVLLRQMGYRIALDDLGAGYSGLVSFTQLEPNVVKLDMALTRDIDRSTTKQKLVRSMLELCRDINILTVAEGIESVAERDTLQSMGCDLLQGYLFAKPAPPFCAAKY